LLLISPAATAQEAYVITSFEATYVLNQDASVDVVEDIEVDFGSAERHGIIRAIPVEYQIEGDPRHHRLIKLENITVDDGSQPHRFEKSRNDANLELKIGDPDETVSGVQRYRISYRVIGALNAFDSHDEFFWNVTGDDWDAPMQRVRATLRAPQLQEVTCYQGSRGSRLTCETSQQGATAQFAARGGLSTFQGLTIVAAVPKGVLDVPPPQLKYIKTPEEAVVDFLGIKPLPIVGAIVAGIVSIGLVLRNWWLSGRDRWFGDVHYLSGTTEQSIKPLFAKETVVVEYTPPEVGKEKRPLRPAEIGLLLDERADTLDVSATIVDLAIRGYLQIEQIEGKGLFGKDDYKLHRQEESDDALLPYEKKLHEALFEDGEEVLLSSLKNKFYDDLAKVKDGLYDQGLKKNAFFHRNPDDVRTWYVVGGLVLAGLGVAAFVGLGLLEIGAIIGVPVVIAGLLMAAMSSAMPRRTPGGREMFRRTLGFREYMVTAETDRQRFYEDASIFDKYLPYAIVYGCTEKWARAFEGIEGVDTTQRSWYYGPRPFTPVLFAQNMSTFSSNVASSIASVPASSGGSGFGGGGFSGGGLGGGGGRSW
jgi:hypothetical protein